MKNPILKSVAAAGLSLAMVGPALADITLYGIKDGNCFKTTYHAKTGMYDTITFGSKSVTISVPERLRGNKRGAEIVFAGLSQVTANLVTTGAADSAALNMVCNGPDAGGWSGFCARGKIYRAGQRVADIFSRACSKVNSWGNKGPQNLYDKLISSFSRASTATTFSGASTVTSSNRNNNNRRRESDDKTVIRTCRNPRDNCFEFELELR